MGATRSRTPQPDAPQPQPQPAPQSDAPQSLGALAVDTRTVKAERVFADVPGVPRVPMSDGRVLAVQRERRADDSLGPIMLAFVKRSPDGRENAQRVTLADIQSASDTFGAHGVTLVTPYVPAS